LFISKIIQSNKRSLPSAAKELKKRKSLNQLIHINGR